MKFFRTTQSLSQNHGSRGGKTLRLWNWALIATIGTLPFVTAEEEKTGPSVAAKINFPIESDQPTEVTSISELTRFDFSPELRGSSALAPTDSESFEVARRAERLSNLMDLNFFAGFYEFDEGPEDDYSAMKAGMDIAITNKIHFEASYFRDHELDASSGFIGLWGAIPLGENKEDDGEPGAVRSLWSAVTPSSFSRIRTRKQHPSDEPRENGYEPIEVPAANVEPAPKIEEPFEERKNVISRVWKTVRQDRDRDSGKTQAEPKREGRLSRLFGRSRD
ncbi:MAG: hypothetical protein AAGH89_14460 [Verrucomicrobiota bacterium]